MPPLPPPYFENAAGRLTAHPAGYLHAYWHPGPRPAGAAQALFGQMAAGLQRHGWSRILIDQTAMQPFSPAEQQWVAREWLPQAVQTAGYRFGAVVVSADVLTRLATAYVTTHVQGLPLLYRSFDDTAAAEAWLLAQ